MKTLRFLPLSILALTPFAKANVVINLSVSQLFLQNGTTPLPDGKLIQLVASTQDAVFAAPTPGNFTGSSADDIVLANFALDSATMGLSGSTAIAINIPGNIPNLTQGDPLMLRWFSTLTTASTGPVAGTQYGQFRSDTADDGSGISWNMPSDGTYALNFLTTSGGGSQPDSAGAASYVVTAVPEPSTYGLLGAGALAVALVRRRRRL